MTPTVDGEAAERQQHWESVYAEKDTTKVGWFESTPSFSLVMFDAIGADPSMAVIDVGAGACPARGRAAQARLLRRHRSRHCRRRTRGGAPRTRSGRLQDHLGDRRPAHVVASPPVRHLARPGGLPLPRHSSTTAALPHDRGGRPTPRRQNDHCDVRRRRSQQCSGLPVARYSPAQLVDTLNAHSTAFELLDNRREEHRTPWGAVQPFTWVAVGYRGRSARPCPRRPGCVEDPPDAYVRNRPGRLSDVHDLPRLGEAHHGGFKPTLSSVTIVISE